MLHTINQSPFESNLLPSCLRLATAGDVLVLIENGVYAAQAHNPHAENLQQTIFESQIKVYALQSDLQARGIQDDITANIHPISYEQFVDLVVAHHPVQAWF